MSLVGISFKYRLVHKFKFVRL